MAQCMIGMAFAIDGFDAAAAAVGGPPSWPRAFMDLLLGLSDPLNQFLLQKAQFRVPPSDGAIYYGVTDGGH